MALKLNRNRVRERADRLHASVVVPEDGEIGIEEFVGLADRNLK